MFQGYSVIFLSDFIYFKLFAVVTFRLLAVNRKDSGEPIFSEFICDVKSDYSMLYLYFDIRRNCLVSALKPFSE